MTAPARVLILGATGMLGHKLVQLYRDRFETWATLRGSIREYERFDFFDVSRTIEEVDGANFDSVVGAIERVEPDVVINAIGIIKQSPLAADPIASLTINSLFPNRVAALCASRGAWLIHISTDCVFSGRTGSYTESMQPDAEDLYGRTKLLGEVGPPAALTLRTSIIGRELQSTFGLVEWFLSNRNRAVRGFTRAIYSGFTSGALAEIIAGTIERHPGLRGVYHVSSDPITKFDLLVLLRDEFGVTVAIEPDESVVIDRSLDSTRFREITGFRPQSWPEMVAQLAADPTPYNDWRQ